MGGKLADFDNREVPDTLEAMWTYDCGTLVTFSQFNASSRVAAAKPCQVEFRGTKGTIYFQGNGYEVVPEVVLLREFPVLSPWIAGAKGWRSGSPMIERGRLPRRMRRSNTPNFLDCIKSRDECGCDMEIGHRSTSATLIANAARLPPQCC